MIDKSLILSKIKDHLRLEKEGDFARFLGIKQNTLSSWHARNTFDINLISQKCEFLNYDFLLTGKEPMLKGVINDKKEDKRSLAEMERENEHLRKVIELKEEIRRQDLELMDMLKIQANGNIELIKMLNERIKELEAKVYK